MIAGFNSFYDFLKTEFAAVLAADRVKEKDFDLSNFLYVLRPFYRGGEFVLAEGLVELAQRGVGAGRQFGIAGRQDDRHVGMLLACRFGQLHSRHLRHRLIGDQKIDLVLVQYAQGFRARMRLDRGMPEVFDHR